MAIRGPQGPRPDTAAPTLARDQPQSPTQRLIDFGSARTPQEAQKLLKDILALLGAAGFPIPKTGQPEQQLSSTLKQLQKQEGLPQTGQLDQKTFDALDRLGLLPKNATPESVDPKTTKAPPSETKFQVGGPRLGSEFGAPRAGGEVPAGTQKTRSVETDQARARVDSNKVEVQVDLKEMLNALKSAGFVGTGKGKEQLQNAVKKLQRVDGLPPTGQLDAKTAASLEKRGVIDPATAQALKEQDPAFQQQQAAAANSSSSSSSNAPSANSSSSNASSAQTPASEAKGTPRSDDLQAREGQGGSDGASGGASAGKGKTGGDGAGLDAGATGTTTNGDVDGLNDGASDDIGNAYAGDDDDDDARRGRANIDDDADDDAGHWEAKKLATQLDEALQKIVRDDDGAGPATYAWEVRLHRPGVYGAKQPAEELLRLVVTRAGPFDAVWQQALTAVNDKLRRYEPEAAAVDDATLRIALQRARYRSG